jgi:hypothetical protein
MNSESNITIFKNWHPRRWVALVLGSFLGYQAMFYWEALPGILALLLLYQAYTNSGCFGSASCSIPAQDSGNNGTVDTDGINFTEIKDD